MGSKHRRHSSVDTLGWMYTNRADEPPPTALDRSISTRISSFRHEVFPALKRQTSIRFNPGEYFAGCFGPRESSSRANDGQSSQHPILVDTESTTSVAPTTTTGRPPRSRNGHSRSLSASFLSNFNFGSMRFGGKTPDELAMRASELNHQAATQPHRVLQQPVGRWVMEDDEEYYLKPPAWKQALRKLRAETKRHVHPAPPRERMDYDAESYEKNFDSGARTSLAMVVDEEDEFEEKARVLHTKLLTKLHSKRFETLGHEFPPTKLLKAVSVPAVPVRNPKGKEDAGVPIWERRASARPLTKLELTRSI
ncbi:hypothetical protein M758_1G248700 [Ceratodon purpureus]|nr:hypothetical protein M758_1G248700 [Ceratodon purpureus]